MFAFLLSLLFSGSAAASVDIPVVLSSGALDVSFVAQFALFVGVMLLGTLLIGKLLYQFLNLPLIAGQIIGGIVLGPSIMNLQNWKIFSHKLILKDSSNLIFSFVSSDLFVFIVLVISSSITVAYLLWLAGHETDIKDLLNVGITATLAGVLGALIPIGMIVVALYFFWGFNLAASTGIGLIFSATSVSIPVALFFANKKLHLRSSKATLGAAIVDDIFAMLLLSFFMIALQAGVFGQAIILDGHSAGLSEALSKLVICFVAMFGVGWFAYPKLITWLQNSRRIFLIAPLAFISMLFYFAFAELFGGLAGITGAYFAGLFHRLPDFRHKAEKTLSPFVNSILLPLFLGSIGLQVDFTTLSKGDWFIVGVLLFLAIVSKLLGTYLATGLSNLVSKTKLKWTGLETFIFGSSMVARGEVGLVVATVLKGGQVISPVEYVISVVVIVMTTIVTPIMLSYGFRLEGGAQPKEFSLKLGHFSKTGTLSMFNIIVRLIEQDKHWGTTVSFNQDKKILTLEKESVSIIYDAEGGLTFKGDQNIINNILDLVKDSLSEDIQKLTPG